MLGIMDKLILEGLEGKDDFVESAQFVYSLKLKNEMLGTLAIDAISDLVQMGLIEATERTKIKSTPLGKDAFKKEGPLDWREKSKIIQ